MTTLAYHPKEFFRLGILIAKWCADEEMYAGWPTIVEDGEGRTYWFSQFGYSPLDGGCLCVFAYDQMNDEYLHWCPESGDINNLDNLEPYRFDTLAELDKYMRTGE